MIPEFKVVELRTELNPFHCIHLVMWNRSQSLKLAAVGPYWSFVTDTRHIWILLLFSFGLILFCAIKHLILNILALFLNSFMWRICWSASVRVVICRDVLQGKTHNEAHMKPYMPRIQTPIIPLASASDALLMLQPLKAEAQGDSESTHYYVLSCNSLWNTGSIVW